MKNFIFTLTFLIINSSFGQNENIYIDYSIVAVKYNLNAENYNFGISIKEKNLESNYYIFNLDNNSVNDKLPDFKTLGYEMEFEKPLVVLNYEDLKKYDSCELHRFFSLKRRVSFVKKMKSENGKFKYKIWNSQYESTMMNSFPFDAYSIDAMLSNKKRL